MTTDTAKNNSPAIYRLVVCLMLIAFATGCTTMQRLPSTNGMLVSSQIEVNDKVVITKHNGQKVKLKVTQVTKTGVHGDGQYVGYSDMREISIKRADHESTLKLVAGIGGAIIVVRLFAEALATAANTAIAFE